MNNPYCQRCQDHGKGNRAKAIKNSEEIILLSRLKSSGKRHLPKARGTFHIQSVNAFDSRLKELMISFHGVSTKYLENYLGLCRMLERYQGKMKPTECLLEAAGHSPQQFIHI